MVVGAYIDNSNGGWKEPASAVAILNQSVYMYDAGENVPAMHLFAGVRHLRVDFWVLFLHDVGAVAMAFWEAHAVLILKLIFGLIAD